MKYALCIIAIFSGAVNAQNVGIGISTPAHPLTVFSASPPQGSVIYASTPATSEGTALAGTSGVAGVLTNTAGGDFSAGIRGVNMSTGFGSGVIGYHPGVGYGVYGETTTGGTGVFGRSGSGTGVNGNSDNGTAVHGLSLNSYAFRGESFSNTDDAMRIMQLGNGGGLRVSSGVGATLTLTAITGKVIDATNNSGNTTIRLTNIGVGSVIAATCETNSAGSSFTNTGGGIALFASSLSGTAASVFSNSGTALVANTGSGANIAIFQDNNSNKARIDFNGKGYFNGGTQSSGADVAEAFATEGLRSSYEPGDVLAISTTSDRTLTKSNAAYSKLVAGVYATKPGVLLTEKGVDENTDALVPMGVIGVIPTKVCNEGGMIRRGDLLVTSSLPGYAMKADDDKIKPGMVIGKALAELSGARGIINVMVNVR